MNTFAGVAEFDLRSRAFRAATATDCAGFDGSRDRAITPNAGASNVRLKDNDNVAPSFCHPASSAVSMRTFIQHFLSACYTLETTTTTFYILYIL